MARVRSLWRTRRARLVVVLLVLVSGVYAGAVEAAPTFADTLTVTARLQEQFCEGHSCWMPPHDKTVPRMVFAKTFRDGVTIAAVRDAIDGISRRVPPLLTPWTYNGICSNQAGAGLYSYDLQFSRFGVPLQDVTVDSRCPFWHISTLGMPGVFDRFDDAAIVSIAARTGMPTVAGT